MSFFKDKIKKQYVAPILIIGMLILFASVVYAAVIFPCPNTAQGQTGATFQDCYKALGSLNNSPKVEVKEYTDDICVRNYNNPDLLVPTNQQTEWTKFKTAAPNINVTLSSCGNGGGGGGGLTCNAQSQCVQGGGGASCTKNADCTTGGGGGGGGGASCSLSIPVITNSTDRSNVTCSFGSPRGTQTILNGDTYYGSVTACTGGQCSGDYQISCTNGTLTGQSYTCTNTLVR